MARFALWLLTAIVLAGASPAGAADAGRFDPAPAPAMVEPSPETDETRLTQAKPRLPPPQVAFGCQRIWRCDAMVCEWRRGCRGVYGYVEGPYYSSALARRQWQSHGLPAYPQRRQRRRSKPSR